MAPKKTHLDLCGDLSNDPFGTAEEHVEFATLTAAHFDTTAPNSKNEDQLLVEVLTNLGPATGMNGGLIVFVEETDELGCTLQVLHNITVNPRDDYRNVFAYYNDVEDGDMETIPFQKSVLVETDEVIVPDTMARLPQHFTTAENIDHVAPYVEGAPFTKKITTCNAMFIPFALIPHVMGQILTLKSVICILVSVMTALGLELPPLMDFLLVACTKTTNNNPPVTITVQDKSEVGSSTSNSLLFSQGDLIWDTRPLYITSPPPPKE